MVWDRRASSFLLVLLWAIAIIPTSLACLTPSGDDTLIDTNITLCTGTYYLNDTNSNGLFNITTSDITLDCNGSTFIGNGAANKYALRVLDITNLTLHNCSFEQYYYGIAVYTPVSASYVSLNRINRTAVTIDRGSSLDHITINTSDRGIAVSHEENTISNIVMNNITVIGLSLIDVNNVVENITVTASQIGIDMNCDYNNLTNVFIDANNSPVATTTGVRMSSADQNILTNITIKNANEGVELQSASGNRFNNIQMQGNRYGLYFVDTTGTNITNGTISQSSIAGIYTYATIVTTTPRVTNVNITNNTVGINSSRGGTNLTNVRVNDNQWGILVGAQGSLTLINSTVTNNTIVGLNNSGTIYALYNNFFNNTLNAYDNGTNKYNTTLQTGTNIIGGSKIGGNYWATPAGSGCSQQRYDHNNDSISDTGYCAIPGGASIDYLPLTQLIPQQARTTISSPANNSYLRQNVSINVTYNNIANITINIVNASGDSITLTSVNNTQGPYNVTWQTNNGSYPDGNYNLTALVIDTNDATNSATISISNITIDNTPPIITWIWPPNETTRTTIPSPYITIIPAGRFTIYQIKTSYNYTEANPSSTLCSLTTEESYNFENPNGMQSERPDIGLREYMPTFMSPPILVTILVVCQDEAGNSVNSTSWIIVDTVSPIITPYGSANASTDYYGLNFTVTEWNPADQFVLYTLIGSNNRSGNISIDKFTPRSNTTVTMNWGYVAGFDVPPTVRTFIRSYSFTNTTFFNALLNGQYTLTLTARDLLNKTGIRTVNFTINDTTPPVWNQSITDITTTSALLNITGTEYSTYTININDIPLLSNTTVNITSTVTGLSPQTTYTLSVTGCDLNNNCNTTNTTFTTLAEPQAPQQEYNHGGGPSGIPSESIVQETASPEPLSTTTENKFVVTAWSPVQFTLHSSGGAGQQHAIRTTRIDKDGAQFIVQSEPISVYLKINETKNVDLDNDSVEDIAITLTAIKGARTIINIKQLVQTKSAALAETTNLIHENTTKANETAHQETTIEKVENTTPPTSATTHLPTAPFPDTPTSNTYAPLIGVTILALIVIIAVFAYRKKKR